MKKNLNFKNNKCLKKRNQFFSTQLRKEISKMMKKIFIDDETVPLDFDRFDKQVSDLVIEAEDHIKDAKKEIKEKEKEINKPKKFIK